METYFDHYVLAGGWAMLLLLPASVVTVAAAVRAGLALRSAAVAGEGESSSARQLKDRLALTYARHAALSADDLRAEVDAEALRLFALLQPLSAMAALAPLAGLLGSVTALMQAHTDAARRGAPEFLAASVERALVPTLWGLAVAFVATAAYVALRARLFQCERGILLPAAETAANRLLGRTSALPRRDPFKRSDFPGKSGLETKRSREERAADEERRIEEKLPKTEEPPKAGEPEPETGKGPE